MLTYDLHLWWFQARMSWLSFTQTKRSSSGRWSGGLKSTLGSVSLHGYMLRYDWKKEEGTFHSVFPFQALRVFVESVLRFGLPVNFQGMVLNPQRKQVKKLRETLNDLYLHLDSAAGLGGGEEIPGDEIWVVLSSNKQSLLLRIGWIWSGRLLPLRLL